MKKRKPSPVMALLALCLGGKPLLNTEQERQSFRAVRKWSKTMAQVRAIEREKHLKPVDYEAPDDA